MRDGQSLKLWVLLASGLMILGGCQPSPGTLHVSPESATVTAGATASFTVVSVDASGKQTPVTSSEWTSSDETIAKVVAQADGSAVATGLHAGTVTLTAVSGTRSAEATLTVTAAELASIAVTPAAPSLAAGTTTQLTATGTYTDATTADLTGQVTWTSSAPQVATVDNATHRGLVRGATAGTAELTASLGSISGHTTVTVTAARLVSIAVTPTNPQLARGTTQQLTATGTYSDATTQDLTTQAAWSTSDENVATVSASGLATAVNTGTATLSAALSGVTGTTALTVTAAQLTSIAVTPANPSLARGTTQQLTATGTYSDATTQNLTSQVTWSSSAATVATVSNAAGSKGLATAVNTGTATLSPPSPASPAPPR